MLDSAALAGVVFGDFLASFPQAARASVTVNGQAVCPSKEYISALAEAFIGTARTLTLLDNSTGVADSPGTAPPSPLQIPGASAAVPVFLAASGWSGPQGAPGAKVFVAQILTRFAQQAQVLMNPNPGVGTGVGVISPAMNSALGRAFSAAATGQLQAAFLMHDVFCKDFNPGKGLNPEITRVFPAFAEAWAAGLTTMTSTISYVGTGVTPVSPSSSVGTGRFL